MRRRALSLITLLLAAAALSGCDKCADYFIVNPFAPHSCHVDPATK